jgi:hypothetical protein
MESTSIRIHITITAPPAVWHNTEITQPQRTTRNHHTLKSATTTSFYTAAIRHSVTYQWKLNHLNAEKTPLNSYDFHFALQQGLVRFSEMWRHVHGCHNLPGIFLYPENGGSTFPRNTATYLPIYLTQAITLTLPHRHFLSARFEYPLMWRSFVSFLRTST